MTNLLIRGQSLTQCLSKQPDLTLVHLNGYLVSIREWSFCPASALCSKNNPRNITHMPAVIIFACLDLEQKSCFLDGHYLGGGGNIACGPAGSWPAGT